MIKKALFLSLATIAFVACKQAAPPQAPAEQTQQQAAAEGQEMASVVARGGSIRCELSKRDGSSTVSYAMKGKKIHTTGMEYEGQNTKSEMISDGEYMYIWQVDTKQGVKTKLPSEEDMKEMTQEVKNSVPDITTDAGKQEFEAQGYTIDCKEQAVADTEFVPPTDVKFTDTSALMQGVLDQVKGQEKKMSPEQQEQLQQMMQQFQQNEQ